MNEKILVLGDGLLGSEIVKQTGWDYVSHSTDNIDVVNKLDEFFDILGFIQPKIIVNCIGYTNTYDPEKKKHWDINYRFVVYLTQYCSENNIKLVHISTDYLYRNSKGNNTENSIPVHQETWYSYCKLLADAYVQLIDNYLMFRCSFKPTPFPYNKAYENVKGNFDYVNVIAKQMIDLINEERKGVWNIGTEYKSIFDLAKQTKPDVENAYSLKLPTIQMDLSKLNNRK